MYVYVYMLYIKYVFKLKWFDKYKILINIELDIIFICFKRIVFINFKKV